MRDSPPVSILPLRQGLLIWMILVIWVIPLVPGTGPVDWLTLSTADIRGLHVRSGLVSLSRGGPAQSPEPYHWWKGCREIASWPEDKGQRPPSPPSPLILALGVEARGSLPGHRMHTRKPAVGCPTRVKITGRTPRGAGPRGPDAQKPWCPLHYLLIPPSVFTRSASCLNSLPRLKVSISGLGPKVKFFGNFQLSSLSYYWVGEGGWGRWSGLFLIPPDESPVRPWTSPLAVWVSAGVLGEMVSWKHLRVRGWDLLDCSPALLPYWSRCSLSLNLFINF